jgi:hypothetical protein
MMPLQYNKGEKCAKTAIVNACKPAILLVNFLSSYGLLTLPVMIAGTGVFITSSFMGAATTLVVMSATVASPRGTFFARMGIVCRKREKKGQG